MRYASWKLGFTLVELVIVIVVLTILATIGFVSYSSYIPTARDANRISEAWNLVELLQTYGATNKFPLPDNKVDIELNGNLLWYQWYAGKNVMTTLWYTDGGLDPLDDEYFTYYVSKDRRSFQLLIFQEEAIVQKWFMTSSYAAEYMWRTPKVYGDGLGIITETANDGYTPIQDIVSGTFDLAVSPGGANYIAHISNSEKIEGDENILISSAPNISCNRLQQAGRSWASGTYTINPDGSGNIQVYCDMETDGGWWTLVVGIEGDNKNHVDSNEVTPTNLSQVNGKWKFSDAFINSILASTLRLSCAGYSDYFNTRWITYSSNNSSSNISSVYDTYWEIPSSWNGTIWNSIHTWVDGYNNGWLWLNGLSYGHSSAVNWCLNNIIWNWGHEWSLWTK